MGQTVVILRPRCGKGAKNGQLTARRPRANRHVMHGSLAAFWKQVIQLSICEKFFVNRMYAPNREPSESLIPKTRGIQIDYIKSAISI